MVRNLGQFEVCFKHPWRGGHSRGFKLRVWRPVELKWKLKAPEQGSAWSRVHLESSEQFEGLGSYLGEGGEVCRKVLLGHKL